MSETLEIVRFKVAPGRREEFLGGRAAAISALRSAYTGLVDARLAELDDGSWIDVVRWRSRQEAEAAAAGCEKIPAVAEWIATIDSVDEMTHAALRDAV